MRRVGWKERPVVVLGSPKAIDPDEVFAVVCGSSKGPDPGNEDFAIPLLGQRPNGHPRTGLFVKTWFYSGWIRPVAVRDAVRLLKRFPDHEFARLREIIAFGGGYEAHRQDRLLSILRIGHDASIRGEGLALRDALARTEYSKLRTQFGPAELIHLLRLNRGLIQQWLMYSEDKRTSGGFWIDEKTFEVGSLGAPDSTVRYESIEAAVAQYVLCELDFWSEVGERRT